MASRFPPQLSATARAIGAGMLDLLYPPTCLGCGARTPGTDLPICPRCLRHLERVDPAVLTAQVRRLPAAPVLDAADALWQFDKAGTLQRVQHGLKYGNRPRYGLALGRLMASAYRDAHPAAPGALVPIPLHRVRLYERGYNQSAWLARGVADVVEAPVYTDALVRTRNTRSQTHLSREGRWHNVRTAFAAPKPEAVRGQTVVLVDDVITTGATALAAADVLKQAGAAAVHLLALAFARS